MRNVVNLVLVAASLIAAGHELRADEIAVDRLMDYEPDEKPQPNHWSFDPTLVTLWRRALARPESELKRMSSEALIQAHAFGYESVMAAIPELKSVVLEDQVHPAARYAAARALIEFDHRESARILFEASQKHGKDLRQLVEPALAAWNFEEIRPVWRDRIASSSAPRRELILAIQGLGIARDSTSVEGLLKLAIPGDVPADVRLAAARSAGQVVREGHEPLADQLRGRNGASIADRLCAVSLISQHQSSRAVQLQLEMAADSEPTIAAMALRSLFANDPKLVLGVADAAMQNDDANVRRVGIESYLKLPSPERIARVTRQLNDPHPELRVTVRDALFTMAKNGEHKTETITSTIAILAGDDWRGQEQAAILLGALDQKQISRRLIELIESKRPEVMVAAAWSLRKLALPETAASVQSYTERITKDAATTSMPKHTDRQMAHLFELLGILKTRQAIPLMETYIPKSQTFGVNSRAAAIWSLGVIQAGEVNKSLADKLLERVKDVAGIPPEFDDVRRASVLSLGRLRAEQQVQELKKMVAAGVGNFPVDLAIRWAIWKTTGEKLPIPAPPTLERSGWFLEHSRKLQSSP